MGYDDLRARLRRHLGQAMRDRDRVATPYCETRSPPWTMPRRSTPATRWSLRLVSMWPVVSLALVPRRPYAACWMRRLSERSCKRKSRRGSPAATTYEERGQNARGGQLRLEADVLLAVIETADGRD